MLEGIAAPAESRRAVREEAEPLLVADGDAAVRALAPAVDALPALRSEQRDDVVVLGDERDAVAYALHDAGALVAEDAGHVAAWIGPGRRVEIGMAHAARDQPYEHLACLRLVQLDVLDDERPSELLEHGCAYLHGSILGEPGRPEECVDRPRLRDCVLRPSSGGALPRIASLRFSSWSL